MRMMIPKIVLDHLGGAEIYASMYFARNGAEIQKRAVEDAEYLIGMNFSGYEDYPQPITLNACKSFIAKAKSLIPTESK